jgi:endonuclease VIII
MPEGDSYSRVAARLRRGMVGRRLVAVDGVAAIRRRADALVSAEVEAVRTHGKHLLVDVSGDLTIHVWMGMPGRWTITDAAGGRHVEGEFVGRQDRGAMRLLLATDSQTAVCYSAPTVEVGRRREIAHALRRLGPDVLDVPFDLDEYRRRVALLPADTLVADMLMDQRVLAGVGNEYKNEVLYAEGIHPMTALGSLGADRLDALALRSARMMLPNAERVGPRVTTGIAGMQSWVYDRAGMPCRRCRSRIASARIGARNPRISFWCPRCQPDPGATAEAAR